MKHTMPATNFFALFVFIAFFANLQLLAFSPLKSHGRRYNSIQQQVRRNYPILSKNKISIPHQNLNQIKSLQQANNSEQSSSYDSSNEMLSKIGSSTSTVVAGTFFLVLAYQRDTFMLTFFIGSILNGISSKVLKKILNQDRPSGFENDSSVKVKPSDKGMPSSHAMSLGFIGMYTAIALCSGILLSAGIGAQIATCSALIIYVALSLIYRVKSQLHTTDQVIVGLCFGSK